MKAFWKLDKDERRLVVSVAMVLSVPMALVVVIPMLFGLLLVDLEGKNRARDQTRSRAEITYTNCLEQNERHDDTIEELDDVIRGRKATLREQIKKAESEADAAALRAQIDALDDGRVTTVSLIDALQPYQDCEELVRSRFGFVPDISLGD